mgnify:CR=1 FL=1
MSSAVKTVAESEQYAIIDGVLYHLWDQLLKSYQKIEKLH